MYKAIGIFLIFGLGLVATYVWYSHSQKNSAFQQAAFNHAFVIAEAHTLLGFNLVDPEQAPPNIHDSVMRGYRLVMNTPLHAPKYARDQLSCTSCHIAGGDTLGGKNGGISLVGVTTAYPQFSKREGKSIDLAQRINNCFQRSMSGNPLPVNSQEMKDIISYLTWISQEVSAVKNIPWLGLPALKSKHTPDAKAGETAYATYCMSCHQMNGEGGGVLEQIDGKTIPPLWGSNSFNDGAGMNTMRMLSSFIYSNMPYQQACLTEEQAMDIAAFVLEQNRPHFIKTP